MARPTRQLIESASTRFVMALCTVDIVALYRFDFLCRPGAFLAVRDLPDRRAFMVRRGAGGGPSSVGAARPANAGEGGAAARDARFRWTAHAGSRRAPEASLSAAAATAFTMFW